MQESERMREGTDARNRVKRRLPNMGLCQANAWIVFAPWMHANRLADVVISREAISTAVKDPFRRP